LISYIFPIVPKPTYFIYGGTIRQRPNFAQRSVEFMALKGIDQLNGGGNAMLLLIMLDQDEAEDNPADDSYCPNYPC
jgi:hypothetical protein